MKKIWRALAVSLVVLASYGVIERLVNPAFSEKSKSSTAIPHDTRTACERLANQQAQMETGAGTVEHIQLLETDLEEDKYEAKVGKQFISTVLVGTALVEHKGAPATPFRFTCLLENDQKAVFFDMRSPH